MPSITRHGILAKASSSSLSNLYASRRLCPEIICHDPSLSFRTSGMSVRPSFFIERARFLMDRSSME